MWATSQGDRTIVGLEAELLRAGIGFLRDMITAGIDVGESYSSDIELFNRLQPSQQLAVLHEVSFALLDDATPMPELTAIREATVFTIFREVLALIEMEIETDQKRTESDCYIRQRALAAFEESQSRPVEDAPDVNEWVENESEDQDPIDWLPIVDSDDIEKWEELIECLADEILWDRDFLLEEDFSDRSPTTSRILKEMTGIADNFFSSPAPDIYAKSYHEIDLELTKLVGGTTTHPLIKQ
ncbi:MAG: hypothetical protein AB8B55_10480 [Mariniblastus sp.]